MGNRMKIFIREFLRFFGLLRSVRKIRTKINFLSGNGYCVKTITTCPTVYMGSDHAGYSICPTKLDANSIIYSFGLGDDISFDLDLISTYNCHVFGADPTPKSIQFLKSQKLPKLFQFYEHAIADYDGKIELFFPKNEDHVSLLSGDDGKRNGRSRVFNCCTIKTFMNTHGHQHIDLLKIDIKGPEFSIIPQILNDKVSFNQLVVEFTPEIFPEGEKMVADTIKLLKSHGYNVFAVSDDGCNISIIRNS